MFKPCGHRILLKPFVLEDIDPQYKSAKAAGIIFNKATESRKSEEMAIDRATVVSVGETCWEEISSKPWCKVGDEVYFAKYSGKWVTDMETTEKFIICNDEDIIAVIKEA